MELASYVGGVIGVLLLAVFFYFEYLASQEVKVKFSDYFRPLIFASTNRYLTLRTFAECEKKLSGVSRVVVISAHIDEPQNELANAVMQNLSEGVKYEFFVGDLGATPEQVKRYTNWFLGLYTSARAYPSAVADKKFEDLFSVRELPIPWHGSPYVFHISDTDEKEIIHSYRGLDLGSGISKFYERASVQEAMTIISLCSASSREFPLGLDVSTTGGTIIPIQRPAAKKQ